MFTRKPLRLLGPVGTKPQLSAHLNVQTRQDTRPPQLDEDVGNTDVYVVRAGAFKEVVVLSVRILVVHKPNEWRRCHYHRPKASHINLALRPLPQCPFRFGDALPHLNV